EVQVVVPFGFVQVAPQAPQFDVVASDVSQPFLVLPSQLAKPELQAGVHVPATQVFVPFAGVQVMPHPPQLPALVCVFVSQPFEGSPSQSANPAEHVGTHVPAGQAVVPFALVHPAPQPPQLVVVL